MFSKLMRIILTLGILNQLIGSVWADVYQSGVDLPEIGANHQNVLSREREQQMGASFYRQLRQHDFVITDPHISDYIQNLGNRLRAGIAADTHLKFFVLPDRHINAFATPGGYIGVNSGLILATASEDELAGVMAHEIAHVSQRHIARFYQSARHGAWAQLGAMLAAIALAASGETQGATALIYAGSAARYQSLISHTREHEQEADRTGIQYLAQAGYDPMGMAQFFEKLQARNLQDDMRFEFLRTHPLTNNRIAEAKERAHKLNAANQTALHHNPRPSSREYALVKARLKALSSNSRTLLAAYRQRLADAKGKLSALSDADNFSRALLLVENGDYQSARQAIAHLQAQDPEQKSYQLLLIDIDFAEKNHKKALGAIQSLYAIYPNDLAVVTRYSQILLELKQAQKGLDVLAAYKLHTGQISTELLRLQAQALAQLGEHAKSQIEMAQYFLNNGDHKAASLQIAAALKQKLNQAQKRQAEKIQTEIQQQRRILERES